MALDQKSPKRAYICGEIGCLLCWRVEDGYFQQKDGKMAYPPNAHQLLKPALVREHGYLYIAAIAEESPQERTWRCAVKDCPNMIIEDGEFDSTNKPGRRDPLSSRTTSGD
jgi:hypothetical protein